MSSIETKKILVVDDEDINLDLMQGILEDDYQVECFSNGEACLKYCEEALVDLVLLDVDMPGVGGLETCRRLHDILPQCPVMFVSAKTSNEERLAGYAAGGYDYIAKPCNPQELLAKIELLIQQQTQHKLLDERRKSLSKAFMEVASGSGELGVLLRFSVNVFSVKNYQELADLVLVTLQDIGGLNAAVRVSGQQESISRTNNGSCSPIESEVLAMFKKKGRIFRFEGKTQINEVHISALIKSMPEDQTIAGRMIDHVPMLLKIASACVEKLDILNNLTSSMAAVETVQHACSELTSTEAQLHTCMRSLSTGMEGVFAHLKDEVQYLSLSEEQENNLFSSYSAGLEQALNSTQEANDICARFRNITLDLKKLV